MTPALKEVKAIYASKKGDFDRRIRQFRNVWLKGTPADVLHELVFCIFTPQSKATRCWGCVEAIIEKNLMLDSTPEKLLELPEMNLVRFKNKKAAYAAAARDKFVKNGKITIKDFLRGLGGPLEMREWLVKNIKGYSYKEASHFMRNVGFGADIAILDRHILRNLAKMGVIAGVPESVTPKTYLEIEKKMKIFSRKIKIPMDALDLILWYKETGFIFK